MAQQNIDFGAFPDDPTADAIRTAFQKAQNNFTELFTTTSSTVLSVNKTPGVGITVNQPVGNVVLNANIYQVNFRSGTLKFGFSANATSPYANYISGSQTLYIELPNVVSFYDIYSTNSISVTGNLNVSGNITTDKLIANYISGDGGNLSNITATVTSITNGTSNISIPTTNGNVTFTADGVTNIVTIANTGLYSNGIISTTGNVVSSNAQITSKLTANVLEGNALSVTSNITTANLSVTGTASFTGTTRVTNLSVTGTVSAVGNIRGANLNATGLVSATGNANVGNVNTTGVFATSISATGNANFTGTVNTANLNSSQTITANYFSGDGGGLSNLNIAAGSYIQLEPTPGSITGNVAVRGDGNIIISSLNTANIVKINNETANFTGNLNVIGNATFGNINSVSRVNATSLTGTLTTAAQPNITSLGTLTGLSVNGLSNLGPASNLKISGGGPNYFLMTDGANNISWNDATLKPVAGSNTQVQFNDNSTFGASANFTFNKSTNILSVSGGVNTGNLGGTLTTASQPNITSVGTLTSLIVNGTYSGVNQTLSGNLTVSGNITGNTIFRAAGTNAAPLLSTIKMRQFVNVDDFGAVGDGSTDDTTAIQSAFNAGAKYIQFTQGKTYIAQGLVSSTSDRVIQAYGATIKFKNSATTNYLLRILSTGTNTQILGGTWDGNKSNNTTLAAMILIEARADDIKVLSGKFINSVHTAVKGYITNRLLVENCSFSGISSPQNNVVPGVYYDSFGVYTEVNNTQGTENIEGNKVKNCYFDFRDSGIRGQPVLFTGAIRESLGFVQTDWEISDNYVLGSTLTSNLDQAICLAARGNRGRVTNNTTIGGSMGWSEGGDDTIIEGNTFKDTYGTVRLGCEVTGSRVVISNNIITGHGIGISATTNTVAQDDCVVSGNYIETDPAYATVTMGVQLQPKVGVTMHRWTISGNIIKSERGLQLTRDVASLVVTGNYFQGDGQSNTNARAIQFDAPVTKSVKFSIVNNIFTGWYRILNFYTLDSNPDPITDVIFNSNQVSNDNAVDSYNLFTVSANAVLGGRLQAFNNQTNPTGNSFVWMYDQTNRITLNVSDSYTTPEGNVIANVGSQFYNTLGSGNTTLWLKEANGNSSTGWTRIGSTQEFADGSAASPSITNKGDTDTGIYFPVAGSIGFTTNGTSVANITSTGVQVSGIISAGGNANVGNLNVATGGRITTTNGIVNLQSSILFIGQTSNAASTGTLRVLATSNAGYIQTGLNTDANSSANLIFTTISAGREWMRLDNGGNLGINNNAPKQTLVVGGTSNITGAATFGSTLSVTSNVTAGGYEGPLSNLTFTQDGTGASTRNAQGKIRETVSATDFGAVGDGVTNDTTAIQNFFNYLAANGGKGTIPAGDYLLTSAISIASAAKGFEVIGEPSSTLIRGGSFGSVISINTSNDWILRGLTIDAGFSTYPTNANHGIVWYNCSRIRVIGCTVSNYKNTGIIGYTSPASTSYYDNQIIECITDGLDTANNGILLADLSASGLTRCQALNVGKTGSPCYGLQLKNGCQNSWITGGRTTGAKTGIACGNYDVSGENLNNIISGVNIYNCNTGIAFGAAHGAVFSDLVIDMNNSGNNGVDLNENSVGCSGTNIAVHNLASGKYAVYCRSGDTDNVVNLATVANDSGLVRPFAGFLSGSLRNSVTLARYVNPSNVVSNTTNLWTDASVGSTNRAELLSFPLRYSYTISTDAITLTGPQVRNVRVDTEGGGATDDLSTINGGYDGQVITIGTIANARDVTVKHNVGNILLNGSADFTLTTVNDTITLMYNSITSKWCEIGRGDNG